MAIGNRFIAEKLPDGTCGCVPFYKSGPCHQRMCEDGYLVLEQDSVPPTHHTRTRVHTQPLPFSSIMLERQTLPLSLTFSMCTILYAVLAV